MQKRKRRASVLAVLLALLCVISSMSVFKVDVKAEESAMKTEEGRFEYVEDTENGGYMIYDYLLNEDAVEIPAEINGKPVTSIDQYSFYQKTMTSVTIPDTVKKIGESAFYECKNLKNVHIPDSVTDLEPYSFGDCYALASFNIPKGITEIPAYAFEWANITSLDIPDNITKIGEGAFGFCENVTSLTIPDSVTEIGEKAFQSCKGLKSFEVPKNVTKLSGNAFMSSGITTLTVSPENPVYDSRDNCNAVIETDTDKLIIGIYGTKIPETIRTIGSHAFESSHELSTLEIPVGVTTIEDYAFDECGSLANLTIPKTVKSIGKNLCCQTRWNSDLGHSVTSVSECLTINCVENSAAHKYAQENGYHFNLISDDDETIYADDLKVTADVDETKLKVGDTFKVTGTVLPENATNKGVNYLSANQDIVTIDSRTGEAKAVGVGKTFVLARSNDGKRTQRFYVTVTKATPTPDPDPTPTPDVTTRYTTHVQTYGWQGDENNTSKWFTNGRMAGTSGQAKRLEGIKISVSGNVNLGIQYTTHCQSYGWLPWSANGEMNGTEGEAKRLEAIKIQLTGADKEKYDVYYRVHAQSYGWLGWAKNGAPSGTAGYAKRLEGIQIVVLKKGASAPGLNYAGVNATSGVHQAKSYIAKAGSSPVVGNQATSNTNPSVAGERNVNIAYRTHVQTYGWQGWKYNGQMSGTSGQAKRLEGINIKLTNKPYSGSIVYTTHVQTYGWQGNENNQNTWRHDGQMSGTSGEAKRLEAIRINLTGEMAAHYDVYYRVHAQTYGWLNWAKNGEAAGTAGLAKRLEGIQIVLVPKNGKAPATRYQGITSVRTQAYIKK
ncbi:leucine-rich repeat protein [Wujia sp.]|uniref:leucine-rich repeat protein n=1 Tax=Wujia sp. TaxID=2944172 RepID=UPI003F80FAE3